ncbi:MAG: T9SS type A sorting domain-containing protein, partial [Bacteroidia bacterium]|nr:T9SS type A sorting domain-containing protein [Bacteroidia bacterium]
LNGVSTLDILLIQRHILGITFLNSPYKMIAADINNDKEISSIDLIELRKLILGIYHRLPENPSWKGIDAKQELDINNPWLYRDFLNVNNFDTNINDADFVGVKVGDVNQSAETTGINASGFTEKLNSINVIYENREVKAGEVFEVQLKALADGIYGYQFAMNLNNLELIDVNGPGIEEGSFAVIDNNLGFSVTPGHPINNNEIMCRLLLRAGKNGWISESVKFNSSIANAEAYIGEDLNVVDLQLSNEHLVNPVFSLYQNQPNPFKEYTDIRFVLEKDESVKMVFTDISGKVVSRMTIDGKAGMNEFRLNRSEFNLKGSGMIYYKLITENHSEVKHMILIE